MVNIGRRGGWIQDDFSAIWTVGRMGALVVRMTYKQRRRGELKTKEVEWEVVVFGIILAERSPDMEAGKGRAIAAARLWVEEAHRKLEYGPRDYPIIRDGPKFASSPGVGGTNSDGV